MDFRVFSLKVERPKIQKPPGATRVNDTTSNNPSSESKLESTKKHTPTKKSKLARHSKKARGTTWPAKKSLSRRLRGKKLRRSKREAQRKEEEEETTRVPRLKRGILGVGEPILGPWPKRIELSIALKFKSERATRSIEAFESPKREESLDHGLIVIRSREKNIGEAGMLLKQLEAWEKDGVEGSSK
ncbi:hypothetical protein KM043_003510 [Ampulex compressa]|nr:hypothetical protein KM043_003510 [Ampulex compressa]